MNESLPLLAALTAGLLGGVHCVGMCGGIVGALSLAMPEKQGPKLPILLSYNTGRITSYVVAGGLVGAESAVDDASGLMKWSTTGGTTSASTPGLSRRRSRPAAGSRRRLSRS